MPDSATNMKGTDKNRWESKGEETQTETRGTPKIGFGNRAVAQATLNRKSQRNRRLAGILLQH